MSKKSSIYILGSIVIFLLISFFLLKSHKRVIISFNQKSVEAEVSDTVLTREKGLSLHAPLTPDQGMLFVFDEPDIYNFWMKDMLFPIDMIFLDSKKQIVAIHKNVDPSSYPKIFGPPVPALYVVEVKAGFSDTYKLEVGQHVSFDLDK